jgi:hypothetical protein
MMKEAELWHKKCLKLLYYTANDQAPIVTHMTNTYVKYFGERRLNTKRRSLGTVKRSPSKHRDISSEIGSLL